MLYSTTLRVQYAPQRTVAICMYIPTRFKFCPAGPLFSPQSAIPALQDISVLHSIDQWRGIYIRPTYFHTYLSKLAAAIGQSNPSSSLPLFLSSSVPAPPPSSGRTICLLLPLLRYCCCSCSFYNRRGTLKYVSTCCKSTGCALPYFLSTLRAFEPDKLLCLSYLL